MGGGTVVVKEEVSSHTNLWVVVEVGFENPFHIGRVCCESVVDVHHGHGVGQEALEVVQQPVMQHIEMCRLLQDAAENWPGLGSQVVTLLHSMQDHPPCHSY